MKTNPVVWRVRLAWAALGVLGLAFQVIASFISVHGFGRSLGSWVNFFSYFTILTNIAVTLWFILGFVSLQRGQARWWGDSADVKGAVLLAGTVTIIVYWTLLVDIPIPTRIGEVANFLLHLGVPLGMWIDWLLTREAIRRPFTQTLGLWPIFPLAFTVYTEIRGPFAHFYPYFFMDPGKVGGVGPLILWLIGVAVLFAVVASAIYWLYRVRGAAQPQGRLAGAGGSRRRRRR